MKIAVLSHAADVHRPNAIDFFSSITCNQRQPQLSQLHYRNNPLPDNALYSLIFFFLFIRQSVYRGPRDPTHPNYRHNRLYLNKIFKYRIPDQFNKCQGISCYGTNLNFMRGFI
jgi:hypothetical protein